ncbi:MAG: efflux RND transporter periplasmic adaptor subunit, partial [Desulfarculus sp.]|nr:efflux RND transporter periplasmic adaptor subunit [Desulfarculus sp.]
MKKAIRLILVLVLLAAAGWGGWSYWQSHRQTAPQVTGTETKVRQGDIRRLVSSTGTIKPQVGAQVNVSTRVSGRVESLLVAIGQEVKAGQVVAVIEHKDLLAKLEQAKAQLNEVQVQVNQARVDLKRQEALKAEDLVSQDAVDKARQQLEVLIARLESNRAQVATAQVNLDFATIRSPIDGVVATIATQQGETVAASLNAPTFMTVVDLGRLLVEDYVDETDIGLVKLGQKASFTVEAFPDRRFKAEVQAIRPAAKLVDDVVYYTVDLKILDDYRGLLKPEMTANVSVVVDQRQNVLWVPTAAVRRRGSESLVFIKENGEVRQVPVKVGWSEGARTQILEGLSVDQTLIIPSSSLAGPAGQGNGPGG